MSLRESGSGSRRALWIAACLVFGSCSGGETSQRASEPRGRSVELGSTRSALVNSTVTLGTSGDTWIKQGNANKNFGSEATGRARLRRVWQRSWCGCGECEHRG